eukprot:CAMPEP_0184495002 /NCGR_PEP_ID=MMETSP0113_2-20130426/30128_1 /TAXON_ID=91329 /ORGANISM="Norrisiella sphaerica, Strain BC52" /LENGTH=496 /DNA_ID=CAMNT_0026880997 /DNA_START=97 /DNA_END=1587 /DNA_ORIENTATION=+
MALAGLILFCFAPQRGQANIMSLGLRGNSRTPPSASQGAVAPGSVICTSSAGDGASSAGTSPPVSSRSSPWPSCRRSALSKICRTRGYLETNGPFTTTTTQTGCGAAGVTKKRGGSRSFVKAIFGRFRCGKERGHDDTVQEVRKWIKTQDLSKVPEGLSELKERNADRRTVIFVNPTSGGRRGVKVLHETVLPLLHASGIEDIRVIETLSRFSVPEQVKALDLKSLDDILVIGGDGTLCGVVQGLGEHKDEDALSTPVGLVPCGSHNHMFKVMSGFKSVHSRIRETDVLHSLLRVCSRDSLNLTVPLVRANHDKKRSPFMCALSFALLADAFNTSEKLRWTGLRKMRYYFSILYQIFRMRQYRYNVRYIPADSTVEVPMDPPESFSEDWVHETGPYQWLGFSPLSYGVPREEAVNDGWGYLMIIEGAKSPLGVIKTVLNARLPSWEKEGNSRLVKVKALAIEPLGDDKEWNMDGEKMGKFEQVYVNFGSKQARYIG